MVVDASAIGEYLLGTGLGAQVATLIEAPDSRIEVPQICDLEVVSGLRKGTLLRQFTVSRAAEMFVDYLALPMERHEHRGLLRRVFELHQNFTPYDAAYVALAERLGATLVTCDLRLTRAARQLTDLNVVGVGI